MVKFYGPGQKTASGKCVRGKRIPLPLCYSVKGETRRTGTINRNSARLNSRNLRLDTKVKDSLKQATLTDDHRDIFHSPEIECSESSDADHTSFQSAVQSPVGSPDGTFTAHPTDFRGPPSHTMPAEQPSHPVEVYIKQDGQFIKIGTMNLNGLSAPIPLAAPVVTTTKVQQTTATLTRQTSLTNDSSIYHSMQGASLPSENPPTLTKWATATITRETSLNDSSMYQSMSFRQGTPIPGRENSPQLLNKWDQSPVADVSPRRASSRFPFEPLEPVEAIRPNNRLTFSHNDSVSGTNHAVSSFSFHSGEVSLDQLLATPDWQVNARKSGPGFSAALEEPRRPSKECQTSFPVWPLVPSETFRTQESVPKAECRLRERSSTFITDLPTYLMPLRNRYHLKIIAVLAHDLIILESPIVTDDDSEENGQQGLRIDSFCRHSRFPESFDPKRNEIMMVDHRKKTWSFGIYDGPSHRVPKEDWASVVLLSSAQAGIRVVVPTAELRPVPPVELLTDLPFVIASLKGIRVKRKTEVLDYLKKWQGETVTVVPKSYRGNCNEVELFVTKEGRESAVNQRLLSAHETWLHL